MNGRLFEVADNVKRLCDGWASEYQCSALAQKLNSSKNVQLTTSAQLLQNLC